MISGAVTFFVASLLIKFFIVDGGIIEGPSMEPNFISNQRFIINKTAYLFSTPHRGDVVQIIENSQLIIKRVIGIPGDTVTIKQGTVWLNNKKLWEPYLPQFTQTTILAQHGELFYQLKAQEYFILGDNRSQSTDSRMFGPVSRRIIIGKVINF